MTENRYPDAPVLFSFRNWPNDRIPHGFTSRKTTGDHRRTGDMTLHRDIPESHVRKNHRAVQEALEINEKSLVRPEQVHGGKVGWIENARLTEGELPTEKVVREWDGVFTETGGFLLMAYSADCPLVFLIPESGTSFTGVLHASWKGIRDGIVGNALRTLQNRCDVSPDNIYGFIAPSIQKWCYEIQEDFYREMTEAQPNTRSCFDDRGEKKYFHLQQAIRLQFINHGVPEKQIIDSGICNHCNENDFFSFRREGNRTGRMAGVTGLPA